MLAVVLAEVEQPREVGRGVHVVPAAEPTAVTRLVPRGGADVLVLCASGLAERAHLAQAIAFGQHPDARLTRIEADTTTWALVGAGRAAVRAADAGSDAGDAVEVARLVLAGTWAAGWLRSVARLVSPAPSMGQHLRSAWRPRTGFLAVHPGAAGGVLGGGAGAVRRGSEELPAVAPVSGGRRLLVGGDVRDAVLDRVARATASVDVVVVPDLLGGSRARYGTRAVEVTAVPLEALAPAPSAARCPVCSSTVRGGACRFCRVAPVVESHLPAPRSAASALAAAGAR